MDDKYLDVLKFAFGLINRQNELLKIVIPAMQEAGRCLIEGRKPTPEQVGRWDALQPQVTDNLNQLTVDVELVRQSIAPLLQFDT